MIAEPFITQKSEGANWLFQNRTRFSVFIPEDLQAELIQIREDVWNFYETEVVPLIPELEKMNPSLLKALLKKMADKGFLSPSIPREYNGAGLGVLASSLVNYGGAVYTSLGVAQAAHSGIGTIPVLYFGNEEQKKRFLPKLASGELIAAYGLTEPDSGSDALSVKTTAHLTADGKYYVLNGQKCWITNGGMADLFTVFAKVDGRHFTAFLVEAGTEGFTKGAEEHKMGIKGSSTVQLFFENCKIPAANLLGKTGKGHIIALNTLNSGRFKLGFLALGICNLILKDLTGYLKKNSLESLKRKSQIIDAKIAALSTDFWALETVLFRTAKTIDDKNLDLLAMGEDENDAYLKATSEFVLEAAIVKIYSTEILDRFGDEFIQILELDGLDEKFPAERIYRDNRITRIFEGTNEINRLLLVEMLLKKTENGQRFQQIVNGATYDELEDDDGSRDLFEQEKALIGEFKSTLALLTTTVIENLGEQLKKEQQIALNLADLLIYTYTAESALLRAMKLESLYGESAAFISGMKMRCILAEHADGFYLKGKTIIDCLQLPNQNELCVRIERIATSLLFNKIHALRIIASSVLAKDEEL